MNAIRVTPVASESSVMEYDFRLKKLVPVSPETIEEIENRERLFVKREQTKIAKIEAEKTAQSMELKDKEIRFLQNSIKKGDLKVRVWYGFYEDGSIGVYAKDYGRNLEKIFSNAENESDIYSDYSEKSRVRIHRESPYFADAKKMADKVAAI